MQLIIYFIICLIATTVGAISGIGGGVIIKPVFDAFSGFPVATISFLSGCTVLAMSIVSMLRARGDSIKIEPRRGTLLAVGAAVGGVAGKQIFEYIASLAANDGLVGVVQSIIMILLTLGVLIYVLNKSKITTHNMQNALLCALIGLFLGIMSAFLGIGGGPINLVVLYFCFSMDTKTAALNSIYIILISQITSFASTIITGKLPQMNLFVLFVMVLGGILGGFIGRAFNKKMSAKQVDTLFLCLLIAIIGISIYNFYKFACLL
ncbi:MAG: sulfite exporter TauE/SafE family protein [Oscillospiraceae bacterium]